MTATDTAARVAAPRALRWVATLLAVVQLLTPFVIDRIYGDFLSTGSTNDAVITPAEYAFSIWGVITVLSLVTCLAMLRSGLSAPWEDRFLVLLSVAFAGFTAWLFVAAQGWLWGTVAIFAVMVAALVEALRLLVRRGNEVAAPTWVRVLATVTFGLYLGWSSVAVFVNVAAALVDSGWSPTETGWLAVVLVMATVGAVFLTVFLRATPGYVAAAAWALIAAAIGAGRRDAAMLSTASWVSALLLLATAAAVTVIMRRAAA